MSSNYRKGLWPRQVYMQVVAEYMCACCGSLLTQAIMPWKLVSSTSSFINTWLVGYSALLGPVIGKLWTAWQPARLQ